MHQQHLADINKLIKQQTELYSSLLSLLNSERDIILASSLEDLAQNNKKKEVIILQINLLDETCNKVLRRMLDSSCVQFDGSPTLKNFLATSLFQSNKMLKDDLHELLDKAASVKRKNKENEKLMNGYVRSIKSSISFLVASASSGNPTYENSGELRTLAVSRPLFSKEA